MRLRTVAVVALVALLVLPMTGCQQIIDRMTPAAIVKTVTVKAKVGTPGASVNGKLEPGYPSDLPLWEGATVTKTHVVKAKGGNSWTATLVTTDPYNDVVAGMAKGFQDNGWTAEQADLTSEGASTTVLTVAAPSGSGVVTIVGKPDQSTAIGYIIQAAGK